MNEIFARTQLGIMNYFLVMGFTGSFSQHPQAKTVLLPLTVVSIGVYLFAVGTSVKQDERIATLGHSCTTKEKCNEQLPRDLIIQLSWGYWASWILLLAPAIWYAWLSV